MYILVNVSKRPSLSEFTDANISRFTELEKYENYLYRCKLLIPQTHSKLQLTINKQLCPEQNSGYIKLVFPTSLFHLDFHVLKYRSSECCKVWLLRRSKPLQTDSHRSLCGSVPPSVAVIDQVKVTLSCCVTVVTSGQLTGHQAKVLLTPSVKFKFAYLKLLERNLNQLYISKPEPQKLLMINKQYLWFQMLMCYGFIEVFY